MLTPREIIAEAWHLTVKERKIKGWGYVYALFETLRELELILYQAYFLYWYFKGETVGYLSVEYVFFSALPMWLAIAITVLLLLLFVFELFIPTIATGAMIGLAAKSHRKETVNGGLVLGLYNFFPLLELHGLFILSSFSIVFTICSLLLRYGPDQIKYFAILVVLMLWLVAGLFKLMSTFAEEAVVIKKVGIFQGIGISFKMIISYVPHLMFLTLLMLVITVRILMNTVMIMLLPGLLTGVGILLTFILPPVVSYSIVALVGVLLIGCTSYFIAYLHAFKQTVWTITFMELSKEKDLDQIEG